MVETQNCESGDSDNSRFEQKPQNYALFAPKTSGAYTELISIGPELVQSIMSFPHKREST